MAQQKKMSLMQLTFIVAVNMMGSGIIMLPTNMAKVGAISLLSWIVTALGSMAIAYGFAQAGVFNQRPGGMAAYAEEAYGKDGYFITFYLYFLSLAIGNVAIAISALGYLAAFAPSLTATPIATCIGVIALLWLTTIANFGGPAITGKIGSVTVWGVIIPVGALSIIGWFWFSGATFSAAWNPQGMSLGAGMGSSIALTLWAFLGMESAAQNSDAVENPKRDVPLACMFGTLGAAVIYILSTSVIQGIVPNADLAASTGPFGLAYARMFNPVVGSIIMALAVLACLGSLLGWQFTLSMTAKSAADERMFPAFFTKVNKMGAPITGMIVMGIVQSIMALTTISPSLSDQFGVLVNLAVVTNVVPYVIALSALPLMMQTAGVDKPKYRKTMAVALVAMLYSVYAIYASGKDAVLGAAIVWGLGYLIWGFIAPRFSSLKKAAAAVLVVAALGLAAAAPASAGALDQIKAQAKIRLGYRTDARPLSFRDESGNPAGYSVALCQKIVDAAKTELDREPLPRPAAGRDRPAVRSRVCDPGEEGRGLLLDPDLPRRRLCAPPGGRTGPAAGGGVRTPGGAPAVLAGHRGPDPAGAGLLRRQGHDERGLAGRPGEGLPDRGQGRSRGELRRRRPESARPHRQRLLRRPRPPVGRREAQPLRGGPPRRRPAVHPRAAGPRPPEGRRGLPPPRGPDALPALPVGGDHRDLRQVVRRTR
jgi:putrescine:ornithine antiporter